MVRSGGGIGQQVKGEVGELLKDVGKGVADVPRQIIEGPAKQDAGQTDVNEQPSAGGGQSQDDQVGKLLEQGQQVGDDTKAKRQAAGDDYGWGTALKSQLGLGQSREQTQKRLAVVRRNLEEEMKRVRMQKQREEEQQKQAEEQQKEQVKEMKEEQKKESRKQTKISQMLGLGKGERRGAKGM